MKFPAKRDPDSSYYNNLKMWMVDYIPNGPNVILDIGCATGRLGKILRESKKADKIVGIEIYGNIAKLAEAYYDKVIVGDVENVEMNYEHYFDYVICGDILEHLRDPWHLLKNIRKWLKVSGVILITIPNMRYWQILLDLAVRGDLEYKDAGILDITHLRFFTRKSFSKILTESGYIIDSSEMMIEGMKKCTINKITCRIFEEFFGPQILFIARINNE